MLNFIKYNYVEFYLLLIFNVKIFDFWIFCK